MVGPYRQRRYHVPLYDGRHESPLFGHCKHLYSRSYVGSRTDDPGDPHQRRLRWAGGTGTLCRLSNPNNPVIRTTIFATAPKDRITEAAGQKSTHPVWTLHGNSFDCSIPATHPEVFSPAERSARKNSFGNAIRITHKAIWVRSVGKKSSSHKRNHRKRWETDANHETKGI